MKKPKTDKKGRAYAQLSKVKAGDKVEADDGFGCIQPGGKRTVKVDHLGDPYVSCTSGRHGLVGQLDKDNDSLIGFYPIKS